MVAAAPRCLAANRAAGHGHLVCDLPALPLGCGNTGFDLPAGRRNARAADLQPAALRPQCAGERALHRTSWTRSGPIVVVGRGAMVDQLSEWRITKSQ